MKRITFVAATLAVLSVELADLGWQPIWKVVAWAAAFVVVATVVRLALTQWHGELSAPAWERAVATVVVYRFVLNPLPTEWLVLDAMRNALLVMLAVPTVRKTGPALMSVSLALVLACSVIGQNAAVLVTAVAFATVGAAWLSRDHRRVPWGAVATVALVAGVVALGTHASAGIAGLLPAWVKSSGGDGAGDDRATSGLGDGPDQQAGANGDAGFDRSDVFCETDGQCLYDAFVEAYGEPAKPSEEKAQWLSLTEQQIAEHREQDLRSGREQQNTTRRFSVRREHKNREASPEAVLWIKADPDQYPLRLPVLAFDHYHAAHWHEQSDQTVISAMDNAGPDGFFRPVDQPIGGAWGDERLVSVSTGTYDANVLPMPGGLTRFKMGRVTRADVFGSAAEPMLRVNRREMPPGSVLNIGYRPAVLSLLHAERLAEADTIEVDRKHNPAAAELARERAGHLPRGWPQVEAVVDRLRTYARYDPDAVQPADAHGHGCPVEQFLHDTMRGDAHLFASSAVLMLQSLGYDARLAGGYYADAGNVDPETGKAIVTRGHAHVWPQVRLAAEAGYASSRDANQQGIARGGQWIDLEPTPGFALADGSPTLAQRAGMAWSSAAQWLGERWPTLAVGAGLLASLVLLRRPLIDRLDWMLWRLRPAGADRLFVERTLALLDRSARRRGKPRPPHQSHAAWLATRDLSTVADWASFAPAEMPPPLSDVVTPFRRAVRERGRR